MRKQQLEGQISVLNEQILAGVQNEEHYKGRLQTIEEELAVRKTSREEAGRRESPIFMQQFKGCAVAD